jgi:protein tyrosine/serine phosphatase
MPEKTAHMTRRRFLRWILLAVTTPLLLAAGFFLYRGVLTTNFGVVVPGQVYRSAQPSPAQVKAWAAAYGLKTIVNLRHDAEKAGLAEETAAAEAVGVKVINIRLSSQELPKQADLVRLADMLDDPARRPLLLHCRWGADRAGIASVMAAMAVGGRPYAEARAELTINHLHVDWNSEHVGGVLDQYEKWCRDNGSDTGGWKEFRGWLAEDYSVKRQ